MSSDGDRTNIVDAALAAQRHAPYGGGGVLPPAQEADILFLPYNYLVSTESRVSLPSQIPWNRAVLIFDEAHNLEGCCLDSASVDIGARLVASCLDEVRTHWYQNYFPKSPHPRYQKSIIAKAAYLAVCAVGDTTHTDTVYAYAHHDCSRRCVWNGCFA